MDCCSKEKNDDKENDENITEAEATVTEAEATKNDHSHGGCCGGGNMWQHMLLIFIIFAIIWFFGRN